MIELKRQPNRLKQMQVILLVDNRKENQTATKANHIDFRNSAFKQTQVDPLQPRPDLSSLNQEDTLILNLKRKVSELQRRVYRLESQNAEDNRAAKSADNEAKKKRRKFTEMDREYKCPHEECQKMYGSQTSLKNHLKLKHNQKKDAI